MQWIAILVIAWLYLGLRDRIYGGSTHVTLLVVVSLVMVTMYFIGLK